MIKMYDLDKDTISPEQTLVLRKTQSFPAVMHSKYVLHAALFYRSIHS